MDGGLVKKAGEQGGDNNATGEDNNATHGRHRRVDRSRWTT